MVFRECDTLSNGVKIPKVGLGTWFIPDAQAAETVRQAVSIGYRHFDTAQAYGNEAGVGAGVKSCGVPREEIFVTSKVAAEHKTYEAAAKSIDESLEKMGLSYIDMMIIHSPQPWVEVNQSENRYFEENRQVWKALEAALTAGKVRAIGVSNFLKEDIDSLWEKAEIKPMVNQVLCHISNTPAALIQHCKSKGIVMEAYSPVAHGEAFKNEKIKEMAEKYGVSVSQLCIRYVLQLGMVALPKTINPEHMKANAEVDFTIMDEDMNTLMNMEKIKNYGEHSHFPVFGGKK
ncbi:aldo/keto reductase [Eubacterium callanderi]|uniref:Aldo/keto reductase n=1 Tax=Eubacterium callanderi TaxID=53442 RepID=A0A853JLD9_9FIRM|nr:aldo/keto reductase [Eubacterium callanderi]